MNNRTSPKASLGLAITASLFIHAALAGLLVYVIYKAPAVGLGTDEGDAYVTTYIVSTGETPSNVSLRAEGDAFTKGTVPAAKQPRLSHTRSPQPSSEARDDKQGEKIAMAGTPGRGETGMPGTNVETRRGKDDKLLRKIWSKINRSRYYPLAARRAGLEGVPRVRFAIAEDGTITSATLASSCGIPELDRAAVQTVHRAAPLPHYPKPITLAIRYSLKK